MQAKLIEMRKKKGIGTKVFMELLHVTRPTYLKKEKGDTRFSLVEARLISKFLGDTIENIFFADEVSESDTGIERSVSNARD